MLLDAFFLIKEPPGSAELDLPRLPAVVKAASQGSKSVVVPWIHVVKDHLGQGIFLLEMVEVRAQRGCLRPVPHAIESGIGAQRLQRPAVDVSLSAQMKLFRPSFGVIEVPEKHHHEGGKLRMLFTARGAAGTGLLEYLLRGLLSAKIGVAMTESVVGEAATNLMEVIMTAAKRLKKIMEL
ncbi:MAG: hypothetical protein HY239_12725 [Mycolicibacterium aromaticivorans]|nr:hypothetical protein [Mycolicibacterium aromaticivorans]